MSRPPTRESRPANLHTATSHPLQTVRNPWIQDDISSSSESTPHITRLTPARAVSHCRPVSACRSHSRTGSLASSTPHSRAHFAHPGCCSPGVQLLCYLCVRGALLACLLGGVALVVAGLVLRQQLGVLLYIGVLTTLVSALLLAVQHQARAPPPRHLAPPRAPVTSSVLEEGVPLQQLPGPSHHVHLTLPRSTPSYVPEEAAPCHHTLPSRAEPAGPTLSLLTSTGRPTLSLVPDVPRPIMQQRSVSGLPWWRVIRPSHN